MITISLLPFVSEQLGMPLQLGLLLATVIGELVGGAGFGASGVGYVMF
jgi:hypothetical protein